MKKYLLALSLLTATMGVQAQSKSFDEKARAYIKEYGAWAIEEQQRVGIPASIKLAQGIYETGAGESELATQANNHFGIKCKKEWQGATFAHTDDAPNECFRKYPTARDSYKDHSDYLKKSPRYAELFALERADYEAWAKGLKKCGYATNPAYAQKLIKMIEDYDLQLYTFAADGKRDNEIVPATEPKVPFAQNTMMTPVSQTEDTDPGAASSDGSVRINDLRAIYCRKGETLLDKAMKYNIRYARLLEINELADEPLKRDMYIYLEPKKSKGAHPTYVVKEGETVEIIAHNEGMNSRQLRIFNLLAQNEQPDAGAVLKLQVQSDERPATHKMVKTEADATAVPAVKLVNTAAPIKQDDFIPTKKSIQKTEELKASETEVGFGYGAAPIPDVKPEEPVPAALPEPAIRQADIRTTPVQKVNTTAIQQAPVVKQENATVTTVQPAHKLESEIAARNDAGNLPQSLEAEQQNQAMVGPQDELAQLKAKLDKAVYARSSKSNVKVSGDDSSSVFNIKTPALASSQQAPDATMEASNNTTVFHVVQKGETGYSIAKKYGIKVKDLNEMNNLNFEGIKTGQKLRIK
jgi:LysM repeat protein